MKESAVVAIPASSILGEKFARLSRHKTHATSSGTTVIPGRENKFVKIKFFKTWLRSSD